MPKLNVYFEGSSRKCIYVIVYAIFSNLLATFFWVVSQFAYSLKERRNISEVVYFFILSDHLWSDSNVTYKLDITVTSKFLCIQIYITLLFIESTFLRNNSKLKNNLSICKDFMKLPNIWNEWKLVKFLSFFRLIILCCKMRFVDHLEGSHMRSVKIMIIF